jgi:mRNA-degrading endonuclease RelE of RelBE toxin-antitoxin system
MYRILFSKDVADDLGHVTAKQRARILNRIEVQLKHEPTRQSRNRKILVGLVPPWEHVEPIWQLRVGEYRIFYDVDELRSTVIVRALRRKPPHKTTEEIL